MDFDEQEMAQFANDQELGEDQLRAVFQVFHHLQELKEERIVSTSTISADEAENVLRPRFLRDYQGQDKAKENLMERFGLTDNPAAYAAIAQNAYQAQNYSTAAQNYYQALLLDDDNYDYAIMTAECYRLAGSTGQASTALTLAIGINASDVRAYRMLQQLYPVVQTRPAAVSQLLQQGATLTGDASLSQ